MPDFFLMTMAAAAAGATAGVILLAFAWPWRGPKPQLVNFGWTLGIGLGIYAGCFILGITPSWPPERDFDRLLVVLLPVAILVECLHGCGCLPRWLTWLLRIGVAASLLPVLLYDTVYLADKTGPGSREWQPWTAVALIAGLAEAILLAWILLGELEARTSPPTVGAILFLTAGAAGVTVMFSSYLSGGQLGIVLCGALVGATAISLLIAAPAQPVRFSGLTVIALFSVLALGRFFGTLSDLFAFGLGLAPLAAWIPEPANLPHIHPRLRTALRLLLVALPLLIILVAAERKFNAEAWSE